MTSDMKAQAALVPLHSDDMCNRESDVERSAIVARRGRCGRAIDHEPLVDDIKRRGQMMPIILLPDGRLLDGRNRLKACRELGIDPCFRTVDPDNPIAYVISANEHRRHLTSAQRAALAAEKWEQEEQHAKKRKAAGNARGGKGGKSQEQFPGTSQTRDALAKTYRTNRIGIEVEQTLRECVEPLPHTVGTSSTSTAH